MEKILLKPGEVCELIGVGKSRCYELIAAGLLPSVRLGRSVRVPADLLRQRMAELQVAEEASKSAPKTAKASKADRSLHHSSTES
jgi:excisionase family DNA binding protein